MTEWETYLEEQAAADAMEWWHGITDDDRIDLFIADGQSDHKFNEWRRDRHVAHILNR